MVHWFWLVIAAQIGFALGVFVVGLITANRIEEEMEELANVRNPV